jgi:hypothetical protein
LKAETETETEEKAEAETIGLEAEAEEKAKAETVGLEADAEAVKILPLPHHRSVATTVIWQGMAMDSLKFHPARHALPLYTLQADHP